MTRAPYRETTIGSLIMMYRDASVATRPDITSAVSTLSQCLDNPGEAHWEAVKRIFRYLSGTKEFKPKYGGDRHDLVGYTDIDGATQDHRRAISWSSRHMAATLLHELFSSLARPTRLYCNNQAALKPIEDDNYHAITKQIDIQYHFVRQVAQAGALNLAFVNMSAVMSSVGRHDRRHIHKSPSRVEGIFSYLRPGLRRCHTRGGVADFDLPKSRRGSPVKPFRSQSRAFGHANHMTFKFLFSLFLFVT
jgi:hypothetical protein